MASALEQEAARKIMLMQGEIDTLRQAVKYYKKKAKVTGVFSDVLSVVLKWAVPMLIWLAIVFGTMAGPAYFKAKTYEELTGHHISWWQAMWTPIRVMEPIKQEQSDSSS